MRLKEQGQLSQHIEDHHSVIVQDQYQYRLNQTDLHIKRQQLLWRVFSLTTLENQIFHQAKEGHLLRTHLLLRL